HFYAIDAGIPATLRGGGERRRNLIHLRLAHRHSDQARERAGHIGCHPWHTTGDAVDVMPAMPELLKDTHAIRAYGLHQTFEAPAGRTVDRVTQLRGRMHARRF